uniref:arylamine N-acetyltransferase n=1 Tax=Anolis carolinensis TaxID=28377 RepID=A0A803SL26_ANOCA
MDVGCYLQRIGYQGPTQPSGETLLRLHRCHLLSVPFESLSIHCGEPITLDLPHIYDKIVRRHRGGFCYELNGLFLWLLKALGFEAKGVSGRVRNRFTGLYGPPLDHLVIWVQLDGRQLLCDVGFGEGFMDPLVLKPNVEQVQDGGIFQLGLTGNIWVLERRALSGKEGRPLYQFTLEEKKLDDFTDMCLYHQTSPSSIFPCKSFCSLHKEDGGRLTYIGWRLIATRGEERTETDLFQSSSVTETRTVFLNQVGNKVPLIKKSGEASLTNLRPGMRKCRQSG